MTTEQLHKMATDLYQTSGDRMPETMANDRDNWMGHRIEQAIQTKGAVYQKLKAAQSREEVFHILRNRYDETTYGDSYYDYDNEDGDEEEI